MTCCHIRQYFLVALVPLQGCGLDLKCLPEDILRLIRRRRPRSVPPPSDEPAPVLREDRELLDRLPRPSRPARTRSRPGGRRTTLRFVPVSRSVPFNWMGTGPFPSRLV